MSGLRCDACPARDQAACAALSDTERAQLAAIGTQRTLAAGEMLFAPGDDNGCATLISGVLKQVRTDADGVERVVALIHPAGFVGELFTPSDECEVRALTDARLCLFPRAAYVRMVEDNPRLAMGVARRALKASAESRALLDLIGRRRTEARVAGLLLALADAAGREPCQPAERFDLPLSRGDMAALLGTTIETVSRQLGALESKALIKRVGRRTLYICDPAGLAAVAGDTD
ncbi:MAG: Crp/Fnr family transcriptional regulator [Sphingopyxis sp.]|nr:Crp/Fnr family transcriptional regulator [Sphingopyxis sp.]